MTEESSTATPASQAQSSQTSSPQPQTTKPPSTASPAAEASSSTNANANSAETSGCTTPATSSTPITAAPAATNTGTPAGAAVTSTTPQGPAAAPIEPPQVTRQKYEEAKLELQALLSRKKQVDTNLINLEHAIYLFEGSYLEDTQQNGNIIRGFEGYLTNRPDKRKQKFTELDRLFSLSSSTYQKALAQKEDKEESSQDDRSTQSSVSSLSMRKDKKRKLKMIGGGSDPLRKKKRPGSIGRDTEEEFDYGHV